VGKWCNSKNWTKWQRRVFGENLNFWNNFNQLDHVTLDRLVNSIRLVLKLIHLSRRVAVAALPDAVRCRK
jgi:hypothetical protein